MKVAVIGGGAMARIILALKLLIEKAGEQTLGCSPGVMSSIAKMQITAIANAVDQGKSLDVLRKKYGVPGYYPDVADTLGAFCPDPLLAELFKIRLQDEVGGHEFGKLLIDAWAQLGKIYGDERVREVLRFLGEGNTGNMEACRLILKALHYRFEPDGFTGHSLRNLFHFALERVAVQDGLGRRDAQRMALHALNLAYKVPSQHRVVTATWESAVLQAETKGGEVITGQAKINLRGLRDYYPDEIKKLYLVPPAKASREAREAIRALKKPVDKLFISCGDTLSTIVSALLADGIKEVIWESDPEIIYVAPQITRRGETLFYDNDPYTVKDLVDWIEHAIGKHPHRIIYDARAIPNEVLKRYPGEQKIKLGEIENYQVSADLERPTLISRRLGMVDPDGRWVHDPEALALRAFLPIFSEVQVGALS